MPNLTYTIRKAGPPHDGPTAIVGIHTFTKELREALKGVLEDALSQGHHTAVALAPRGKEDKNRGRRISDAIRTEDRPYHPGGHGGGGYYEAALIADANISPQVRYVFEGTAEEGRGNIYPAHGNVLRIEKEGEGVKFRPSVRGQKPQTEWWEAAQREMENFIQDRIRTLGLGEAVRK
jgi:hypothetical protein